MAAALTSANDELFHQHHQVHNLLNYLKQTIEKLKENLLLLTSDFVDPIWNDQCTSLTLTKYIENIIDELIGSITFLQENYLVKLLRHYAKQEVSSENEMKLLEMFQDWFESLFETIQETTLQLDYYAIFIGNLGEAKKILLLEQRDRLLNLALVMGKQYSFQILQMDKRIVNISKKTKILNVNYLLGRKLNALGLPVTAYLVCQSTAKQLSKENSAVRVQELLQSEVVGETKKFIAGPIPMSNDANNKMLSATFTNCLLNLESENRKDPNSQPVAEKKYYFYFHTCLHVSGETINIGTFSLPCVIKTHVNQNSSVEKTLFWHNSFGERFDVPNEVPWPDFANFFRQKFQSFTGKPIDEENLQSIRTRLIGHSDVVAYKLFFEEDIPGTTHSLWTWLYEFMCLIAKCKMDKHLCRFIKLHSRVTTEELLKTTQPGTFIIRYSHTALGTVIVSSQQIGHIKHLEVLNHQMADFTNFIAACIDCHYLFPETPKRDVFQIDYKSPTAKKAGYDRFETTYRIPTENSDSDSVDSIDDSCGNMNLISSSNSMIHSNLY